MHLRASNDMIELEHDNRSTITETTMGSAAPMTDLLAASIVSEHSVRLPSAEVNTTPWIIDIQRHRACDDLKMFVPSSHSTGKRHCCTYCHKRYRKFVRHLENVHKSEAAVMDFHNLSIGKVFFHIS